MHLIGHHSRGFWAMTISLGTFLALHLAVYVAHEQINKAAPDQRFLYAVDRSLEPFEKLLHLFDSEDERLRYSLTHILERVEELEKIAGNRNERSTDYILTLLAEIQHEVANVTQDTINYASNAQNVDHYTLLLHAQTILDHIYKRVLTSEMTALEENVPRWDAALASIEALSYRVAELATTSQLAQEDQPAPEESANPGPAQVPAGLTAAVTAAQPTETETAQACGTSSECASNADCCLDQGYTCQQFINSQGEFTNRCAPQVAKVCEVRCEGEGTQGAWTAPLRCMADVVLPEYPSCGDLTQKSCRTTRGPQTCVE